MAAESDRGPGINTQAPIHLLCDQPWTVEGVLLQQRGGGGARKSGGRRREEDGDSGIPPRSTWLLSKAFISPSAPFTLRPGPLSTRWCYFSSWRQNQPNATETENIHQWPKHRLKITADSKQIKANTCCFDGKLGARKTAKYTRVKPQPNSLWEEAFCLLWSRKHPPLPAIRSQWTRTEHRHFTVNLTEVMRRNQRQANSGHNSPRGPEPVTSWLKYIFTANRRWLHSATALVWSQDLVFKIKKESPSLMGGHVGSRTEST